MREVANKYKTLCRGEIKQQGLTNDTWSVRAKPGKGGRGAAFNVGYKLKLYFRSVLVEECVLLCKPSYAVWYIQDSIDGNSHEN